MRNTAAAKIADIPLGPNPFAIKIKLSATLIGKTPELSPKSKNKTKPEIATAIPSSAKSHINLLISLF